MSAIELGPLNRNAEEQGGRGSDPAGSGPAGSGDSRGPAPEATPGAGPKPARPLESPGTPSPRAESTVALSRMAIGLIMAASLVMVLWNLQDASLRNANTGSRYATIESLVDYGTFAIDKSRYRRTIDKVKLGGHYYSSKPPVLPTFGAGVYWAYQQLTGRTIAQYEGQVVWLGSLATGWLSHFVFLLYLVRLGRLVLRRQLAIVGMVGAGAFAYLGAGYATTLNNHSVAAAFAVAGLYHTLRARAESRTRDWVLAGIWLGFLPSLDLPSGALSASLGACLLLTDWRKALRWFAPAAIVPVAVHLGLTHAATGGFVPAYMRKELYDYTGSYWLKEAGIDALREAKPRYAFHMLLGHHGLFSMTPLLVFSLLGLRQAMLSGRDKAVARAVALSIAAVVLFLVLQTHNYGGWCVGMRWLVPAMALLLVYFGLWLDGAVEQNRLTTKLQALLLLCFAVSAFHTQDALSGPFQFSRWHNWLEHKPNRNRTGDKVNLGRAGAPRKAGKGRKARRREKARSRQAKPARSPTP